MKNRCLAGDKKIQVLLYSPFLLIFFPFIHFLFTFDIYNSLPSSYWLSSEENNKFAKSLDANLGSANCFTIMDFFCTLYFSNLKYWAFCKFCFFAGSLRWFCLLGSDGIRFGQLCPQSQGGKETKIERGAENDCCCFFIMLRNCLHVAGCFLTVPHDFQYQNEKCVEANLSYFFKECYC